MKDIIILVVFLIYGIMGYFLMKNKLNQFLKMEKIHSNTYWCWISNVKN